MKSWKRWGFILVLIVAISYPAAWLMARNSDAYSTSESFLRSSPHVIEALGSVKTVSLSPLGYSIQYAGARGDASFEMSVEGEKETATAFIELQKRGVWEVKVARLVHAGQPVIDIAIGQK